jgi:hypothetical protein
MAATRSRDPVLAKIRLMCVLTVWLLRNSRVAISGVGQSLGDKAGEAPGTITTVRSSGRAVGSPAACQAR